MSLSLLTAVSLNGVITPRRGESADSLFPLLDPPKEVLEWKGEIRRRHGAVLVGTNTVVIDDPTLHSGSVRLFEGVAGMERFRLREVERAGDYLLVEYA